MNAKGGFQPIPQNASVLRVLGYQLYQQGRHIEAFRTLREALRLEPNVEASQLFEYLRQREAEAEKTVRRQAKLRDAVMTAMPSVLVLMIVSYGIYSVATAPSGYETNYKAPPVMAAPKQKAEVGPRSKTNALIEGLAGIVESRSPIVGTHNEGTTIVQDHELDRSKFDEGEIYPIAESVGNELHSSVDTDGFLASAYFNAKLFALSIDVIKRLDSGRPINSQVTGVLQLGNDPSVSRWLQNSRFGDSYTSLCSALRSYSIRYRPGTSTDELERQYREEDLQLRALNTKLQDFNLAGDTNSYNALIPQYNATVKLHNSILREAKLQTLAARKLDLAFNRCLDTGILMSKFQKFNLVSHAADVDALPDSTGPNQ